jgi:seryl-tRNA synthetase
MLDHFDLGNRLGLFDFEAGVRVSGAGFPFMLGAGAMLQRALVNFMLDLHIREHGYTEVRPPFIVAPQSPLGTGQLPKFGHQMYHVHVWDESKEATPGAPDFYLIPTAEVPVANFYREQILEQPVLPLKFCAYSPCFRVEAGSYGADVRGLKRLHQFEKVELVRVSDPETSWDDLEQMTREAEVVLERLGIPYRRKVLPTGDMAHGSAKTYDIELHAPLGGWLEVSSASNTTDWQSRRANIRIRKEKEGKLEFPHLLNASGLALPRLMVAILELNQNDDGSVTVPEPLRPYLGRMERISP